MNFGIGVGLRAVGSWRLTAGTMPAMTFSPARSVKPRMGQADTGTSRTVVGLAPVLLFALLAGPGSAAWANDRPFQIARTAVMEDDEQVWSFESWVERRGKLLGLSIEPEYTFSGGTSLQLQLTRNLDRNLDRNPGRPGELTGHEVEVEFKHIFNHIGRDGWGLAVSGALGVERSAGDGTVRSFSLKLPLSINLGEGFATLHLNPGLAKASDARRVWTRAVAIEREVFKRTTAFAELAQEGDLRFGQVGARHWLRRDKLAIDLAWQLQRKPDGQTHSVVIGLGWYDL